ncbi:hypothetical protein MATR_02570 [Marivirga tractuosa]|uniref:Uncharacterized protein n=1 Tax=Marivirga tractuosa (strain ATCC 23168 / DSM 4126 / NBRC 15989 / NCIMB 1408 / VKM B-1430 / H-43) TaxID=643867 RepID=E4TV13_MARTH|nr:hypothetical protein [Marivirga tractuosa]ADR22106.1 hypothetical protein Ftrac_2124 [Marivirga tractuosa DSM 4126]BDD13432.1 hypothetical protein MATR_02570 [Marivirga tractuosa]
MDKETQFKRKEKSENITPKKKEQEKPKKEEEERNGIIPEGMDFKKFMGCGG